MTLSDKIHGRNIGIIGMARSGIAAAFLVKTNGGRPFVSDSAPTDKLAEPIRQLKLAAIPYETGAHSEKLLACDFLVLSPGVPLSIDILRRAREKGIPCFSEIELAAWVCQGGIVAITGSNGKTTTTTLTGEILRAGGLEATACGNIGLPFSEIAPDIPHDGLAVVEVSTFQLESIETFHPETAAILNLSLDHLDRHGSFEAYVNLKYRVAENLTREDYLVLNQDDPILATATINQKATAVWFSTTQAVPLGAFVREGFLWGIFDREPQRIIATGDIRIPGPHNLQNAAAAVAIGMRYEVPPNAMAEVLSTFTGVEHRLELVGKVAGVTFINDSKATNVDSVCYALRSVDTPLYLIAGGRDKGAGYEPLIKHGAGRIKGIIAIGEAKEKIFHQLGKEFPVEMVDTLEQAVHRAFALAHPGETVLLSPACASFDMFENFEQRGRVFKEIVAGLKNGKTNHTALLF
jgi:UDP-N-acetylmuramoylalanine--D-glutamate ligase